STCACCDEREETMTPLHHAREPKSNEVRDGLAGCEPRALRTYTPTQAVLARSAGVYHWTPEGRRLYDFTSGVLVSNLGHNPRSWLESLFRYMAWEQQRKDKGPRTKDETTLAGGRNGDADQEDGYCEAMTLTAYNAVTPVE